MLRVCWSWSQRAHFWYREADPKGIVQAPNGTVSALYKRPSENPVVQRDQMGHASYYIYGSQLCCCCFLCGLPAEWHDNSCIYPTNYLRRGGQQGQLPPGGGQQGSLPLAPNSAGQVQIRCIRQSHSNIVSLRGWFRCEVSLLFCFAFYAADANNAQLSLIRGLYCAVR